MFVCGELNVGRNENNTLQQCTYNVTLRHCRETIVAVEKQRVLHILSVSLTLGMQRVVRMRYSLIRGPQAVLYFST
jgi:hypothetical protein